MEAQDQIITFKEYLQKYQLDELLETVRKGYNSLTIDFMQLTTFSLDLSDDLIDHPVETIKAGEIAVEQIDLPKQVKDFRIRVKNLPSDRFKKIAHVRKEEYDHLWCFEGVIRGKTGVLANSYSARYECPSCGNIIPILQLDHKMVAPSRCGCGRKGKFKLLGKERRNIQRLEIEELPENVFGNAQPQKLRAILSDDHVAPGFEEKFNPGCRIRLNGIIKELPIYTKTGALSTDSSFILDVVYIEPIEEEDIDTHATAEEIKEFRELASGKNSLKKLVKNTIPNMHGYETIKEALLLQIVGGVRKVDEHGRTRGDIHILLIGNPGEGKSGLLKGIKRLVPFSREATGQGASGAGLTAAAVRDDFLGGWTIQAGTLVLANNSIALIDEFDKMNPEDRSHMHEAMEQQTINVDKVVKAQLNCQTSILAAANPKYSKFDPYMKVSDQINLPSTLVSRFDLIFPFKEEADSDRDREIAEHILLRHQGRLTSDKKLDYSFLRKYLFYAKTLKPKICTDAYTLIVDYYVEIKKKLQGKKSIAITPRQLEGLVRLSEGYAKLRLSKTVEKEDSVKAIELTEYYLREVAYDAKTDSIDIGKLNSDFSSNERNNIKVIVKIIDELYTEFNNAIPLEEVVQRAYLFGLDDAQIKKAINSLKKTGDVYIPRKGTIMNT